MENNIYKLTEYTLGGGCGCKIPPGELKELLQDVIASNSESLLVGNSSADDAAVYALNESLCLISTCDFFTPIVDNPYDFGRIAAANAISDVYAMGGKPIIGLSILAWPRSIIPLEIAAEVLKGAVDICKQAGITLAGGHSIENKEPIFGLAVNGIVDKKNIKKNNTAQENDLIFLTKPIGTGIVATAIKRGMEKKQLMNDFIQNCCQLNKIGEKLGLLNCVTAMTDVTGFGLLGHLLEMTDNGRLSANLTREQVPLLEGVKELADAWIYPDNTMRNWKMYGDKVFGVEDSSLLTLSDPQTNGGLLFSITPNEKDKLIQLFQGENLPLYEIGFFTEKTAFAINVE